MCKLLQTLDELDITVCVHLPTTFTLARGHEAWRLAMVLCSVHVTPNPLYCQYYIIYISTTAFHILVSIYWQDQTVVLDQHTRLLFLHHIIVIDYEYPIDLFVSQCGWNIHTLLVCNSLYASSYCHHCSARWNFSLSGSATEGNAYDSET